MFRCLCERFGWHRDDSSMQSCVAPETQEKATDSHITDPASLRKVEGNRKKGNVEMEQNGRILADTANLESATKLDITATLRHHESVWKSTNAGAPGAARVAIASRIEILKQAISAKEPFRVQLVKVQAALTRAEEVVEKKHSAVLQDELIAGGEDVAQQRQMQQLQQQGCARHVKFTW